MSQARCAVTGGQVAVWLDGTPVTTLTRAESLGTNPVGYLQLGDNGTSKTFDVAFDDVAASAQYVN